MWATRAPGCGATVPRAVLRLSFTVELPVRLLHAIAPGDAELLVRATPRVGEEIRVELRRGADVETGYLPVGRPA